MNFNQFWNNNLPISKRSSSIAGYGAVIMRPLQWLWDIFFDVKFNGLAYQNYDNSATYSVDDIVCFYFVDASGTPKVIGDFSVYICIQPTTAGIQCSNNNYWSKINSDIFGIKSYEKITSQSILLEYALWLVFNEPFFGFIYEQPISGNRSDIYIENINPFNVFRVGAIESESSNVVETDTEATAWISAVDVNPDDYQFSVNVPQSLSDALIAGGFDVDMTIRNVVDKFNLVGINYTIIIY